MRIMCNRYMQIMVQFPKWTDGYKCDQLTITTPYFAYRAWCRSKLLNINIFLVYVFITSWSTCGFISVVMTIINQNIDDTVYVYFPRPDQTGYTNVQNPRWPTGLSLLIGNITICGGITNISFCGWLFTKHSLWWWCPWPRTRMIQVTCISPLQTNLATQTAQPTGVGGYSSTTHPPVLVQNPLRIEFNDIMHWSGQTFEIEWLYQNMLAENWHINIALKPQNYWTSGHLLFRIHLLK